MGRISLKPFKQALALQANPLADNLKVKINKRPIRDAFDQDGNPITIDIEVSNPIKLFKNLENKHLILSITNPASLRLLFLIIYNIQDAEDYIRIEPKRITKALNITTKTLSTAIKDLTSKNIILKSNTKHFYWINPSIIFFGSRKNKYHDKLIFQ